MRIGIDFDNTIACYDEAFLAVAKQEKLLPESFTDMSKTAVRDAIRKLPEGEYEWQRLQGLVYGKLIMQARLFDGVEAFFIHAKENPDVELYIVSHKTLLAHHDPAKTSLRASALHFLEEHAFFDRLGLPRKNVFFESTREEKVSRISTLRCDVFIDDLAEVLLDANFPSSCRPVFFSTHPEHGLKHFSSWKQIKQHLIP